MRAEQPQAGHQNMLILTFFRFGWVNASYVYGLDIVNIHMKRALGTLTPWDTYHRAVLQKDLDVDAACTVTENLESAVEAV